MTDDRVETLPVPLPVSVALLNELAYFSGKEPMEVRVQLQQELTRTLKRVLNDLLVGVNRDADIEIMTPEEASLLCVKSFSIAHHECSVCGGTHEVGTTCTAGETI